jgi:hypothetical protein
VSFACPHGAGTLSVCHIPQASRALPEPSFLFNWMASHEPKQAAMLYAKLVAQHPHLPNVQVGAEMGGCKRTLKKILLHTRSSVSTQPRWKRENDAQEDAPSSSPNLWQHSACS